VIFYISIIPRRQAEEEMQKRARLHKIHQRGDASAKFVFSVLVSFMRGGESNLDYISIRSQERDTRFQVQK
jgi:hypothetical protein